MHIKKKTELNSKHPKKAKLGLQQIEEVLLFTQNMKKKSHTGLVQSFSETAGHLKKMVWGSNRTSGIQKLY